MDEEELIFKLSRERTTYRPNFGNFAARKVSLEQTRSIANFRCSIQVMIKFYSHDFISLVNGVRIRMFIILFDLKQTNRYER